ncbi:hypothetical protein QJS04_geneDACA010159 [Acorus gramineus]|uniref:Uncharacterized protein n=1 Tax=Acorus gramineus TaxID=55184 RepID=A0AAV9A6M9_ACOGR|nr:hypothetical protein QJS04_geneDACA010159 [Acorus gramineus]
MAPVLMKKAIITPPALNVTLIRRRGKAAGSVVRRPQPTKPSPGSPPQHNSIPNAAVLSTTQFKKPSPGTPPQHN